jgi:threonyl-tRNA synthetase
VNYFSGSISNKFMDKEKLDIMRHSVSHLMAAAVKQLFGDVKFAIGPTIEDGFYYDFDLGEKTLKEEDLPKIEEKMREIAKQNLKFEKEEVKIADALKKVKGQPYKEELIKDLEKEGEKKVSFYKLGDLFEDLCRGPHVKSTKEIGSFKLLRASGAYWRGDENNKMLQRIYGTAFDTQKELDEYLKMLAEAEKRDHRKIGKEQKIFMFSDLVGPGLPLWLPNGGAMIEELEKLAKEQESRAGYLRVRTPHIAKEEMYKTSGHLPYYADTMFPPMILEEENGQKVTYYLKAMNCPHHHQIYASEPRSYRDLPLRLAEYGTCYRYEKSGELFGLMRVRSMQMNDAHIYCTEEQFEDEFLAVIEMYLKYFKIFGINKYVMRFSTHSKEGLGKKYIDNEKLWNKTENMVRKILTKGKIPFVEVPDEAAFYGPKIDVEIWSAIGREFTLATNQVDFAVPERFSLVYKDNKGKDRTPICIHRAPLGTHERLIGFLIEHYAGNFPTWLAPVQVRIINIGAAHKKYCQDVYQKLFDLGIRAELNLENETVGNKIRKAEKDKIPYALVVGDKEMKSGQVAVRKRGEGDKGPQDLEKFIEMIKKEIKDRK